MAVKQAFRPPKPVQRNSKTAAVTTNATTNTKQATSSFTNAKQATTTPTTAMAVAKTATPVQQRNQLLELQSAANKQDQEIVTRQDSLQVVKSTLEAGISTICYLRRLLPDDHFADAYMASSIPPPEKASGELYGLSQPDINASQQASGNQPKVFKYPKIVAGASEESDKILRMIEDGVMDAVAKGYLRSFMFIIFLDKNEPENIVESYTFNVFYAGTDGVPTLDVRHNVGGAAPVATGTPESEAVASALDTPQTHQAVRRAVKNLMKTLILGCQKMEDLPRRRFVDFKLAYNETCPEDYEAPAFKDCTGIPLFMNTDEVDCPPVKIPMGDMATGSLGLSVTTLSIAEYLPARRELLIGEAADEWWLDGEVEEQMKCAERRNVVWNADLPIYDRTTYNPTSLDPYTLILPELDVPKDSEGALKQPLWRRLKDGSIERIGRVGEMCFGEGVRGEKPEAEGRKRGFGVLEENTPELSPSQRTQLNTQHSQLSQQYCIPALQGAPSLTSHAPSTQPQHHGGEAETMLSQRTGRDVDADGETDYGGSQFPQPYQLHYDPLPQEHSPGQIALPQLTAPEASAASAPSAKRSKKAPTKKAPAQASVTEQASRDLFAPTQTPATPFSERAGSIPAEASSTFKPTEPVDHAVPTKTPKSSKAPKAPKTVKTLKTLKTLKTPRTPKPKTDRKKKVPATPLAEVKAALAAKAASRKKTPKNKAKADPTVPTTPTTSPSSTTPITPNKPANPASATPAPLNLQKFDWVNCFCGAKDDEDGCMQCDGCDRWVHCPCVGFTGLAAAAHVGKWYCLMCEMERDKRREWGKRAYVQARSKLAALALFRRALLTVRHQGGLDRTTLLKERLGCSAQSVSTVVARLMREGFIASSETKRSKNTYNAWVRTSETSERVHAYFTPGGGVETELFDYRKEIEQTPEAEEEGSHPTLPPHANLPARRGTSIPLSRAASLKTTPTTITTREGNMIPSLDGRPKSQYELPAVRSSRAEEPIELMEDW
ncbi:hypothetical protein IAT38_002985 [Cryptococcus sp. DSM 104549]